MEDDTAPYDTNRTVTSHYARHDDLVERLLAALPLAGGDPERPTYEALHHIDQFHLGGPAATRDLAELSQVHGSRLLDLGSGIGGPSRMLANEYGCDVTGLDLTEAYCHAARTLSERVGLAARTRFVCASALDLPFAAGTWELVWTQHASMNIPDKARLYHEAARVLAPGGRLVLYDIIAGPMREPRFPVPWASSPAGSFLLPAGDIHERLRAAGLHEVLWRDKTADALAGIRAARDARDRGEPEPPGPQLIMGPEFGEMRVNMARNLEEGRIALVQAIWRKNG